MKLLHTMIRVGDLERSKAFYRDALGMRVVRESDYPEERFTLVYLAFPGHEDGHEIELTYNYGVTGYDLGSAFGHIAVETPDVRAFCAALKEKGVETTYGPAPMGRSLIAFLQDPDGYKIELIQRGD